MDRLWAPWRGQYVREAVRTPGPDCFLCAALAAPAADDRANLIAWRRPNSVVILNRFPYNTGHLLVAPLSHKGTLGDLNGPELLEPIETVRESIAVLDRLLRPKGYNVGLNQGSAAGAGLPGHLHWHVVPRWDGDSNFMPVLAATKVIVESLDEFLERFTAELGPEVY